MLANWKTTLAGVAAIIGAVSGVVNGTMDMNAAFTAIVLGIGLILGKDFNITGGTK